ncbi:MAG TPA: hypothetical protein PL124_07175 [Candidatus Cloacimonadota bacterium]|nr:hypothetical protein [Candidatus Cloacimonadota bacterium]
MIVDVDFSTIDICFPNTEDVDATGDVVVVKGYTGAGKPCRSLGEGFKDRDIVKRTMVNADSEVLRRVGDVSVAVAEVHHAPFQYDGHPNMATLILVLLEIWV